MIEAALLGLVNTLGTNDSAQNEAPAEQNQPSKTTVQDAATKAAKPPTPSKVSEEKKDNTTAPPAAPVVETSKSAAPEKKAPVAASWPSDKPAAKGPQEPRKVSWPSAKKKTFTAGAGTKKTQGKWPSTTKRPTPTKKPILPADI